MREPILHPSPNHEPRRSEAVDMLVIHYTGMRDGASALGRLCDPAAKVSAHYLIEEDGTIFSLVPESERAWHAGASFWRGDTDVNSRSIGIEMVNPGHEFGYRPFPRVQMDSLIELCIRILARHPIPPRNVVAHSDVAPARKEDPGEFFDWPRLKSYGIGLWPFTGSERAEVPEPHQLAKMLNEFGYDTGKLNAAITAFQRHYRPAQVDGTADFETVGRLVRLLGLV